ncbi:MAG: ArsR/SmtB family transcription factor [Halanaeroarchaeum sp.]
MSGLLPSSSEPEPPDGDPRVIGVDDADAEHVLAALSSDTARTLLAAVHDEPATPSELAERADTSLQNAQYHLEKLDDADLIEVIDTRYSEKGREMQVFGPSGAPVVLFAGGEDAGRDVRSALASLLGGVGVLGLASLVVQRLVGGGFAAGGGAPDDAAAPTANQTGDVGTFHVTKDATRTVTEQAADYSSTAIESAAGGIPPGLLFFVGGVLALALVALWWYVRR